MALTVTINNDQVNISTGMNVAYVTTDTVGVYKFRYLLELTYHVDNITTPVTKTISFTQQQNNAGQGIFNLAEIYKTIVTPQITPQQVGDAGGFVGMPKSIHNLPLIRTSLTYLFSGGLIDDADGYESFHGVANVMTLKFYEMYSATATGIPTKQAGTEVSKTIYLIWGRGLESEGVVLDWTNYLLTANTKQLLSDNYYLKDGKYQVYLGKDDYHTLAFFNLFELYTASEPKYLQIEYFDSSDASLGTLVCENTTASGGAYDATVASEKFYLYGGIGLSNLQKIDTSEAPYTGTLPDSVAGGRDAIKYYDVYFSSDSVGSTPTSITYRFNVQTYCSRYEVSRLSYMNRFGAWEYINLNKKREDKLKVNKEYVTKPLLTQQLGLANFVPAQIDVAYPPEVAKQGQMTTSVSPEESFTLFTDNLKDYEIEQIKDLMMSPQIHLLEGENAKALVLETSEMKLKGDKNLGLFKYELKFKYASPKYRTT